MQDIGVSVSGLLGLIITSSILIAVPGPSIMLFVGQVHIPAHRDRPFRLNVTACSG